MVIAEDNLELLRLLSETFESEGFHVLPVSGGDDALTLLKTEAIDLVISDVHMVHGTGIDLLGRLAHLKRTSLKFPPIIIMSGLLGKGERILREMGACEVIAKPFDVQALIDLARKHVGFYRADSQAA